MTSRPQSVYALAFLAALTTVGAAGCLCPPCPGKAVAGPNALAGDNGPAAPVVSGSRLVIWNGDGEGATAQGWEGCDKKDSCKVKLTAEAGAGLNDSNGLKFHGEGPGWIGIGWNLFGWYPENAGVDLSPYNHLTFQIRVVAKTRELAPEPTAVNILLGCSKNKKDSSDANVEKYQKGFSDGKWHKVSIPITAFTKGAGAQFDLQSFWEFRVSTWSGTPRDFDIYIDDIAAEKQ